MGTKGVIYSFDATADCQTISYIVPEHDKFLYYFFTGGAALRCPTAATTTISTSAMAGLM